MSDPLTNIEDKKSQTDLGTFAYRAYLGARDDGASRTDAICVVIAFIIAIAKQDAIDLGDA